MGGGCLPGTGIRGVGAAGPRDHSFWEPGPQGVPSLVVLLDTALWPCGNPVIWEPREEEGPFCRVVGA